MNTVLHVLLKTSPDEAARLRELQALFAQACNAISPLVQKTRVWNRVALHHMAYKLLRGAVNNAIGLYRGSMLAQEDFGVGRHPAEEGNLSGDAQLVRPSLELWAHGAIAGEDAGHPGLGHGLEEQIGGLAQGQAAHEQAVPVGREGLRRGDGLVVRVGTVVLPR